MDSRTMSQHLLFDAAGIKLAVPAALVKSIHESLTVQAVSCTKEWFAGMAVAGGKLLPVTDLGAFSGRRACTGRTLELDESVGIAALRVDQVLGFSDVEPTDASAHEKDANRLASDANLVLTDQVIVDNGSAHRIVDIAALVQSPVFINIEDVVGE